MARRIVQFLLTGLAVLSLSLMLFTLFPASNVVGPTEVAGHNGDEVEQSPQRVDQTTLPRVYMGTYRACESRPGSLKVLDKNNDGSQNYWAFEVVAHNSSRVPTVDGVSFASVVSHLDGPAELQGASYAIKVLCNPTEPDYEFHVDYGDILQVTQNNHVARFLVAGMGYSSWKLVDFRTWLPQDHYDWAKEKGAQTYVYQHFACNGVDYYVYPFGGFQTEKLPQQPRYQPQQKDYISLIKDVGVAFVKNLDTSEAWVTFGCGNVAVQRYDYSVGSFILLYRVPPLPPAGDVSFESMPEFIWTESLVEKPEELVLR